MGKTKTQNAESNVGGVTGKGFKPGESGNPGGLTKRQREVRDQLHTWLASEPVTEKFKAAYLKALESAEPAIVKDCADRLLGKVKSQVELSNDPDRPLQGMPAEVLIAALKGK